MPFQSEPLQRQWRIFRPSPHLHDSLGVDTQATRQDVRYADGCSDFSEESNSRDNVGPECRPSDDAELRRVKGGVRGATEEDEEASIDPARAAVVEPEPAADPETLAIRADEVFISQKHRGTGLAEEAQAVGIQAGGCEHGNPHPGHPPKEELALDESPAAEFAIGREPRDEPVAHGPPAQFGERGIIARQTDGRRPERAVL